MFVNTLPANARQLLGQLGQDPPIVSFYLAGGSAAALHLGHRISVDLDFFTPYHLVRALAYFVDAEEDEPPSMLVPLDWSEVKRFFEDQVQYLMQRL